jgi:hypothetical protein
MGPRSGKALGELLFDLASDEVADRFGEDVAEMWRQAKASRPPARNEDGETR